MNEEKKIQRFQVWIWLTKSYSLKLGKIREIYVIQIIWVSQLQRDEHDVIVAFFTKLLTNILRESTLKKYDFVFIVQHKNIIIYYVRERHSST